MNQDKLQTGFTLVEMAVVLVIVGLLLSGLLIPITAQLDQRDYAKARSELQEIREALLGYAVINGRLPCPDITGDGIADSAPADCSTATTSTTGGNIPWIDLGIQPRDPWQQNYRYRVSGVFTATFNLATAATGNGILRVCTDNTCGATFANNIPAIVYSAGKNGGTVPISNDEVENNDNDKDFVSHDFSNATGAEFDDLVVWISPNVLMSKMVAANKLP